MGSFVRSQRSSTKNLIDGNDGRESAVRTSLESFRSPDPIDVYRQVAQDPEHRSAYIRFGWRSGCSLPTRARSPTVRRSESGRHHWTERTTVIRSHALPRIRCFLAMRWMVWSNEMHIILECTLKEARPLDRREQYGNCIVDTTKLR